MKKHHFDDRQLRMNIKFNNKQIKTPFDFNEVVETPEERKKRKQREYKKQWYEKNKEKCSEYGKKYRADNREHLVEYGKRWRADNKVKIKQYRADNKERIAEKNKQYRAENKEYLAEKNKHWRADNKVKIKQYRADNKERIAEKAKQYRANNKEIIAEKGKQYRIEHRGERIEYFKQYFKQYHSTKAGRAINLKANYDYSDKKKGFDTSNNIDTNYIVEHIFTSKCYYCGDDNWEHLGADRISNTKPHTPDNVVCCCGICNVEKNDNYSVEEFKQYRTLHPRAIDIPKEPILNERGAIKKRIL